MIPEIEEKDAIAAFVRIGGALEQFEAGTIEPVNKDDDGH